jgi:dTDP-4-amino-4,6-dideoxygalactose transaminase
MKMVNTNTISNNLIRLPMYYKLKNKDIKMICKNIFDFFNN